MAERSKPKLPPSERRGVNPGLSRSGESWEQVLVQLPDGTADADAVVDRLLAAGVAWTARRDVAADVFAGRLPTPTGEWFALVGLLGQRWLYVADVGRCRDPDALARAMAGAGLRSLTAGYGETAGATWLRVYEGTATPVDFESMGMGEGEDGGDADGDVRLAGTRFDAAWLARYEDEIAAQDAMARAFDAYLPEYIAATRLEATGAVTVVGHDGR